MNLKASAFHPDLPGGRGGGRLILADQAVRFEAETASVALPYRGLQVTLGGANDALVFLSHPDQPAWSIQVRDRRLLTALGQRPESELTQQVARLKGKRRFRWAVLAAALALVALLPVGLLFSWNGLVRFAASQVPASWEERMGEAAVNEYAAAGQLECDGAAAQALGRLAEVLVTTLNDSRYEFRFCIARDPEINAFAVPGGTIVVQTGLVENAGEANEVIGVLAHELAHVTAQHGTRAIINSLGWLAAIQLVFGDVSGVAAAVVAAAPALIHLQYSQRFEAEADELAVDLLQQSGVDPEGLAAFLESLLEEENRRGVDIPSFLRSHPATAERIRAIRAEIDPQGSVTVDLSNRFLALKAALREE